jgi:DNA polymerase-3 subunit delta'
VIEQVDRLSSAATNALLKILEEPAPQLHIFLLSAAAERILPTIVSRCLTLYFNAVSSAQLQRAFPEASATIVTLAQGLPGKVSVLLQQPLLAAQQLQQLEGWIKIFRTTLVGERLQLLQPWLKADGGQATYSLTRALKLLSVVLRSVLHIQCGRPTAPLAASLQRDLEQLARQYSVSTILQALTTIQVLWRRQQSTPIQKKLVLTNLLLTI